MPAADEAWQFIQEHSTQAAATAEALRLHLPDRLSTLLDFGCGTGDVIAEVLGDRELERIELVDPEVDSLEAARQRVRAREIVTQTSLDKLPTEPVQVALANQVLFFVDDLDQVLGQLVNKLRADGRLLITHAGEEKSSTRLRERFYKCAGLPDPYYRAEDVEATLQRLGLAYEKLFIESFIGFPDTPQNRELMLRFLMGSDIQAECPAEALQLLDDYQEGDDIRLRNLDRLLIVCA